MSGTLGDGIGCGNDNAPVVQLIDCPTDISSNFSSSRRFKQAVFGFRFRSENNHKQDEKHVTTSKNRLQSHCSVTPQRLKLGNSAMICYCPHANYKLTELYVTYYTSDWH
jgi:hypothetical protein